MDDYYFDGQEAFRMGASPADCPHPIGSPAERQWTKGYWDAANGAKEPFDQI
jgi:hypothetical protein